MNRKRLLIILGVGVGLVLLVGVGIALASVWPMISGDQVVVGPPPDETEFAAAPVSNLGATPEPVTKGSTQPDEPAEGAVGVSEAELLVGEWQTFQPNEQQEQGAYFVFYEPEYGTAGELWYCPDPTLADSYEGWVAAEWELGDDGVLIISPITVGFVSSEYEIEIRKEEEEGQVYRTLYMSPVEKEEMGIAGLVKAVPPDPEWDDFRPEPYDAEVFTGPTDDQVGLAEDITATHFPQFEVDTVLVEAGDSQDESYMGDALHVAARLTDTDAMIVTTYYVASEEGPAPSWLDAESGPDGGADGYRVGETDDGTQYLWSDAYLDGLRGENPDPTLTLLLEYVAYYYPDSIVGWVEVDGESTNVLVTRWDAYVTQEGWFSLVWAYNAAEELWELESSNRTLG